jgi:hypothetical protein
MDLFIEITGPLAVVVMITLLVICAVDGIKRAPAPYYDYTRANILSLTAIIYGIVGATLAGWSWYRYVAQTDPYGYRPNYTDGHLISIVALGIIIAAIAAGVFGFGGYRAGRGFYRASRTLRQRILKSLSVEEQRSLVLTLPAYAISDEVNQRLKNGARLTLSNEGQREIVLTLDGDILSAEVLARVAAGTLSVEEQRSLAQALPGDILSAEVLARIDVGTLGDEEQRSLVQALSDSLITSEASRRIAAGKLDTYEVRRIIEQAPRQSVLAVFCDLNLSSSDLTPYYLGRLAKLLGLNRLVTMVSGMGADNLDDDDLKKFADFFDLDRLVDMLIIQINTREERSSKRLSTIDRQIGELNSALRESDSRASKLRRRFLDKDQEDSELPDALRSLHLDSLTGNEVERLKGLIFTDEERKELLSELMEMLTSITQGHAKNGELVQQRNIKVREQNGLSQLRPATQNLKDLIVFYGIKR